MYNVFVNGKQRTNDKENFFKSLCFNIINLRYLSNTCPRIQLTILNDSQVILKTFDFFLLNVRNI